MQREEMILTLDMEIGKLEAARAALTRGITLVHRKKRFLSADARARISAAQHRRWALFRAGNGKKGAGRVTAIAARLRA